jgi:hypothetical protein
METWLENCRTELDRLANEFVDWDRSHGVTAERALHPIRMAMQDQYFIPTRRTCWAYVQAASPIDVKRAIWHHESDELIGDPRLGKAHVDVKASEPMDPLPGVRTACYAWTYVAMHRPWLEGLSACHILERQNDPRVVKGKTSARRRADWAMQAQGVSAGALPERLRMHLDVDSEHSDLIWDVFARYVNDEDSFTQVVRGARESLDCYRAFKRAVVEAIEESETLATRSG